MITETVGSKVTSISIAPLKSKTRLIDDLRKAGFQGDIAVDEGTRTAASTDNSLYQIVPDVVAAPDDAADLACLLGVLAREAYLHLGMTPRGGGTGTNGQALNRGVIVDCRPRMRRLLALDVAAGWADVEPGMVLDELNAELAPHGLFFPPDTSTADHCTIGGMIATDASGKGSRIYGKTGDSIMALDLLLADGSALTVERSSTETDGTLAPVLAAARAACDAGRDALAAHIPHLARSFVGYDLIRARPDAHRFDATRLLIGSEGTLAFITRARLKLVPRPRHRRLVVIGYRSFDAALASAESVLAFEPTAIETLDDIVHELAAAQGLLNGLPPILRQPLAPGGPIPVGNYVEFTGDDPVLLDRRVDELERALESDCDVVGWHAVSDDDDMRRLWGIRKASVGLVGSVEGRRRPVAFVEDCVVPPARMRAFVSEFRALLDREGLTYGMYGHVDVGCIHVRPALDISVAEDRDRVRRISDAVFDLVRRHGGIFWGEHGKGVRGEYLKDFVGDEAYAAFQEIKRAFDPLGRMNPGKLVDAAGDRSGIFRIDTTPMRVTNPDPGEDDPAWRHAFRCNGNAQCQSYAATVPMCPSFKATGDRRHSPKGRADLVRAWLHLQDRPQEAERFAEVVHEALDGCLGCKACSSSCPIHVDVPEMKSRFLEDYHRTRRRPLGHHALRLLEPNAAMASWLGGWLNGVANSSTVRALIASRLGLVDLPAWSRPSLRAALKDRGVAPIDAAQLQHLAGGRAERLVVLVPDAFTLLFDVPAFVGCYDLLTKLGYKPLVASFKPAGKPLHVKGFRPAFTKTANEFARYLRDLAASGVPLLAIEPSLVMMLRQDYRYLEGLGALPPLCLPQEFLREEIDKGTAANWPKVHGAAVMHLFLHCTEKTALAGAGEDWRRVSEQLGVGMETVPSGCCGMAGSFGHERHHQEVSRKLFEMSWREPLERAGHVAATGFSCRSQSHRLAGLTVPHPAAYLAANL